MGTEEAYREPYKYGFVTPIENDSFEKGLNEDVIRKASRIRKEPEFMLKYRLDAYEKLQKMKEPHWCEAKYRFAGYRLLFRAQDQKGARFH